VGWGVVQFNDRKIVRYSILILVLWEIWERCEMAEMEKRMNLAEKKAKDKRPDEKAVIEE
jgi:hypothetical protein